MKEAAVAGPLAPTVTSEVVGIDKSDGPGLKLKADLRFKAQAEKRSTEELAPARGLEDGSSKEETITYDEGSVYTGQVQDGQRHGRGVWQCKTGQYDGQWILDMQSGQGRQTWSDGRVYDGQFKNGMFDGYGRMTWHTQKGPLTYEGEYIEDLKHGRGKFIWADGRSYDGEWQRGKRHGRGAYVNSRSEKRTGYWVADQFESWETAHDTPQQVSQEEVTTLESYGR